MIVTNGFKKIVLLFLATAYVLCVYSTLTEAQTLPSARKTLNVISDAFAIKERRRRLLEVGDEDEDEEAQDEEGEDEDSDEDPDEEVSDEDSAEGEEAADDAEATEADTEAEERDAEDATEEDAAAVDESEAGGDMEETTADTAATDDTAESDAATGEEDVAGLDMVAGDTEQEAAMPSADMCPIDLETGMDEQTSQPLAEFLESLVEPCTATNDTTPEEFCGTCVRPLQTFLAREFHLADLLREEEENWDSSDTTLHESCAVAATDFLQTKGMPYDDAFHEAVFKCIDYANDDTCTIPTEELVAMPDIAAAIKGCQDNSKALSLNVTASGGEDATDEGETHPFCTECYWKFFEAMSKATMSKEFMCKVKNKDHMEMSEEEVEKNILEDPHMFACLLNVEGYLRNNDLTSASIGFSEMEAICFNDLNHPMPSVETPIIFEWLTAPDMVEKMAALEC